MDRMRAQAAYDELIRHVRDEALLASCVELLGWDEQTYMPRRGAAHRSRQLAYLTGRLHERVTHPRKGELLAALDGPDHAGDTDRAANVREIRRQYARQCRLPRRLVEELARVTTLAQAEWEIARRDADFARFRPWLEQVVFLKREEAQAHAPEGDLYDGLLEDYEPGARTGDVERLFADLQSALVPLVQTLTQASPPGDPSVLGRDYPPEQQRVFVEQVARDVGFDFRAGRLDTTVHPFCCAVGPGDCRLAIRYRRDDLGEALFGTLHEVGHGLYEQGLPSEHHGTPLGEAASLGLHEAQARLWENGVGRSRAFWRHFFPAARAFFPGALAKETTEHVYAAVNHVEPTPIRASADELTYNLHILARFELERALLDGRLCVVDLPAAWADAYRRFLGVTPPDDAFGCLQDGHWAAGLFGYFPTYTLGNLYAAQLLDRADADLGGLDVVLAAGRFQDLRDWLSARVYGHGSRYRAAELVTRATGQAPGFQSFFDHLHRKYGELYGL